MPLAAQSGPKHWHPLPLTDRRLVDDWAATPTRRSRRRLGWPVLRYSSSGPKDGRKTAFALGTGCFLSYRVAQYGFRVFPLLERAPLPIVDGICAGVGVVDRPAFLA